MKTGTGKEITAVIGNLPYRMAFAGGWIDQPFVSRYNPSPPGSMVVVALEPNCRFMNRCGMGTSTRVIASKLWDNNLPDVNPDELVEILYAEENKDKVEPSGSQDMIGMLYPGVNRLDYDYHHSGGVFPVHIETNTDLDVAVWLETVISMVPVAPRPDRYNPLGVKDLAPEWIQRLGQSGKDCYDAIIAKDAGVLGASMNETMLCWEKILPHTVRHPTLTIDLMALWDYYRTTYAGAMYSGCGGGYLYVVSEKPVPGGFRVKVRSGI
jgi:hypothetical protein